MLNEILSELYASGEFITADQIKKLCIQNNIPITDELCDYLAFVANKNKQHNKPFKVN
jgi:hypothetical protein